MVGDANDGSTFQKIASEKVIDDERRSVQVERSKDVIQKYGLCGRVYRSSQADSSFLAATNDRKTLTDEMLLKATNLPGGKTFFTKLCHIPRWP